jgi:SAM-dependent methyltransferase
MPVHDTAATGYARAAHAYEQGRPGYPDDAMRALVHALRIDGDDVRDVLEVGAGTGKCTRALVQFAPHAHVIAVEPLASMRALLTSSLPNVDVRAGTAEALPLDDESVDAIVIAQAFHWFANAPAVRELHRVLRPGGHLGLMWNVRDVRVPWVGALERILEVHEGNAPRHTHGTWRAALGPGCGFTALEHMSFTNAQPVTVDTLCARVASISYIAALDAPARDDVLAQVRALVATHPDTRDHASFTLPHRTDVYRCERA